MKLKAGIIGSGNIGTDLLMKMLKSNKIDPVIFVGRRSDSDGIYKASQLGIKTSTDGIAYFKKTPRCCDVIFDCTNALSAVENNIVFQSQNINVIDLTPSKIGNMCIPIINGDILSTSKNINMITCGGQASIPVLHLIAECSNYKIEYIEIVSQIASKSAGLATRLNIDQYIHTTEDAIKLFTKCNKCKVILNINPAFPYVDMQTTIFVKSENININELQKKLNDRIKKVQTYVPFYEMVMTPIVNDDGILIFSIRIRGIGDYLPSYAGNLDIINCASIYMAEKLVI